MRIGFIGVGVMGGPMAKNLMACGHGVAVYTRTRKKAAEAVEAGAEWAGSVAECAKGAEAVITIVGFPKDVEEVYLGSGGLLDSAERGAVLIDMTTSRPDLAVRIAGEAARRGLSALDAPVSGGDAGAKAGTLAIMVGGDEGAFLRMRPVFEAMGKNVRYMGPAGSGQHTKMANQIAIAATISGVCECLSYARAVGLDPRAVVELISAGAASSWQLTTNAPKILDGNFSPAFYLKHFVKDLAIAEAEAGARELELPALNAALAKYRELEALGYGDAGIQALAKGYSGGW